MSRVSRTCRGSDQRTDRNSLYIDWTCWNVKQTYSQLQGPGFFCISYLSLAVLSETGHINHYCNCWLTHPVAIKNTGKLLKQALKCSAMTAEMSKDSMWSEQMWCHFSFVLISTLWSQLCLHCRAAKRRFSGGSSVLQSAGSQPLSLTCRRSPELWRPFTDITQMWPMNGL